MLIAAGAYAQNADDDTSSAPPTFAEPPKVLAMEQPQPGDHWAYETRDEIKGRLTWPRTTTVTELTPTEISVRISAERQRYRLRHPMTAPQSKRTAALGPVRPMTERQSKRRLHVSPSWAFTSEAVDSDHGFVWVRNGSSKVLIQERVMTKAGPFDTFLTWTSHSLRRSTETSNNKTEIMSPTWSAPAIDHCVRCNARCANPTGT